jgi:hypothetical protein
MRVLASIVVLLALLAAASGSIWPLLSAGCLIVVLLELGRGRWRWPR